MLSDIAVYILAALVAASVTGVIRWSNYERSWLNGRVWNTSDTIFTSVALCYVVLTLNQYVAGVTLLLFATMLLLRSVCENVSRRISRFMALHEYSGEVKTRTAKRVEK